MTERPQSDELISRLKQVRENIAQACLRCGRAPDSARLLAVSKKVPLELIHAAIEAGQTEFGENYVQEAVRKAGQLACGAELPAAPVFHLIGSLQRNKAKQAAGFFSLIHTVDRLEVAQALDNVALARNLVQPVLLQINISGEESKSGAVPEQAGSLAAALAGMKSIRLCGLMCIGTFVDAAEPENLRRREFAALRSLRDQIAAKAGLELPELSMGMSHDYELAVEEGATIVRVGSAIFGERD